MDGEVGEMHLKKIPFIIVVTLILYSPFLIAGVTAEDAAIESKVDAGFDAEFKTATDLKISVTMDVSEIKVFKGTYNKDEIENVEPDDMGAIKYKLRELLKDQIEASFKNANVAAINNKPIYENKKFYDEFSVNLTFAFFEMVETVNAHDFVNGMLDINATVSYTFDFQAQPGWNNTYTMILPGSIKLKGAVHGKVDGNRISWEIKNWKGNATKTQDAELSTRLTIPTSTANKEKTRLGLKIDFSDVEKTTLETIISLENIDIEKYGILPDFISNVNIVPSDGIRLLIDNGLLSWNSLQEQNIMPIETNITAKLEERLNQTLDFSFNWNDSTTINCTHPYNISKMDDDPPIKTELFDGDVKLKIQEMTPRALFGLLNAGGTTNLSSDEVNLGDLGYDYDGKLILPKNISLTGKNIYSWNYTYPIKGLMKSEIGPIYKDEKKNMLITVDISKTDLNLLDLFKGKTCLTLNADIINKFELYRIIFPEIFDLNQISLEYLNADAMRLILEENVVSDSTLNDFLTEKKAYLEEKTAAVTDEKGTESYIDEKSFYDSLKWNGDIYHMDDDIPVEVILCSRAAYLLPFNVSFLPPSGTASNQTFNLSGDVNHNISYKIIFPKGMSITADDVLNIASTGVTGEGREYVYVAFVAGEGLSGNLVNCSIKVSALFIILAFQPCIIGFILLIIFIIVIYLIKKRKRKGKTVVIREERRDYPKKKIEVEQQEEEYYIPPAPGGEKDD
ncbi:hypothetical protein MBGDN05_00647 [Thermoplasmatales archaeon SCGC AB-539-N05]|nr:hypothetical protein MBGDN05_00647 [Thermoplasmatales archaeon SCGC AB-539-N05]